MMEAVSDVRFEVSSRIKSVYLPFALTTRHLLAADTHPWNLF
jgi:hypothetical protein